MQDEETKSQGDEPKDTLPDGSPAPKPKEETSNPSGDPKEAEITMLKGQLAEKDKQVKGVLVDLQGERSKRHLLEDENRRIKEVSVETVPDPLEEIGDSDEPITVGTLKKLAAANRTQMERQRQVEEVIHKNKVWESDKDRAKKSHTVETEGEGLDFDSVAERGQRILDEKPYLKRAIIDSDAPAEDLYQMGLSHPESRKLLKEQGGKEVVRKMAEQGKKPATSSTSSGGGGSKGISKGKRDLSNQTPDELRDLAFDPSVSADDLLENLRMAEIKE